MDNFFLLVNNFPVSAKCDATTWKLWMFISIILFYHIAQLQDGLWKPADCFLKT